MSATLADDELLIARTFDAPASLVFALWTDPAHFRNWMGPGSYTCTDCDIDLRVGGAYRARIASADDPNNWFGGVYREIVPHERLVFTFKWDNGPSNALETLVTITFREHDGKTVMTFHQSPFLDAARRDSHVGGWSSAFDKAVIYANRTALELTS
ncbi:MAG: SRPBCC domain-containing protein [Hyphomonadaceae bacterium]|nr:SRPBCC domain-containing protein [Hyphomonadaceae bacterium]